MKKNKIVKIMAFLALFGIIIGIVGTGILVLTTPKEQTENIYNVNNNISEEEMKKIIDESKLKINTFTGKVK